MWYRHYTASAFSAFSRHTMINKTMNTKGIAPSAMILFTTSILFDRIMTNPSAPKMTPRSDWCGCAD